MLRSILATKDLNLSTKHDALLDPRHGNQAVHFVVVHIVKRALIFFFQPLAQIFRRHDN